MTWISYKGYAICAKLRTISSITQGISNGIRCWYFPEINWEPMTGNVSSSLCSITGRIWTINAQNIALFIFSFRVLSPLLLCHKHSVINTRNENNIKTKDLKILVFLNNYFLSQISLSKAAFEEAMSNQPKVLATGRANGFQIGTVFQDLKYCFWTFVYMAPLLLVGLLDR